MASDRQTHHASPGPLSLEAMAKGLGVFSIALGLAELLAPRGVARAAGMHGRERLIQSYGLREIGAGIGLLASRDPRPWLWARVAGDVLDVSTLAAHAGDGSANAGRARAALVAVAPIVVIDLLCARIADGKAQARAGARFDYSDRVGMAEPADRIRGAASDFEVPADMRQPEALRPYAAA